MKKKTKLKICLILPFLAAECVLFALFLAEDFASASVGDNVALKYATVMLALLFALVSFALFDRRDFQDGLMLVLALALTLVADLFLLVLDDFYIVGLIVFIGAQICHFARIKRNRIWWIASISARVLLSVVAIVVLVALGEADALTILAAIYFVQLVGNFAENVVAAFTAKDKRRRAQAILLSVGFLLFIGCDISVGLANLYCVAGEFEWLFYTPSQVLIALSLGRMYETETN